MKQVLVSLVVVMLAAGIFAGTVLYTVSFLRQAQARILTGEFVSAEGGQDGKVIPISIE